jgi:hypothetical protein
MPSFPALAHIAFPECVSPYLERVNTQMEHVGFEDVDLESGFFRGGPSVPAGLWREYLLFTLVETLNEVIDSLNVLIADMEELPTFASQLKGRPSKRVELLARSFYSEFFRGREVTLKVTAELRRRGFLSREVAKTVAAGLDEQLGDVFRSRHSLVHGDAGFAGESYTQLRIFEEGVAAARVPNLPIGQVASPTCEEKAKAMRAYGEVFRAAFSKILDLLAGLYGPVV